MASMEPAVAAAYPTQPTGDESSTISNGADGSSSDAASLSRDSAAWWSQAARTLPGVSQSCLRLAALRAEETARTDLAPGQSPLVSDPFAAALAGHRRPDRAHHVFRQANRKQVREAASCKTQGTTPTAAAAAAPTAAESQASSPSPIAAESANAVADAVPPPSASPSVAATAPPAPSHTALRAELQSQASLQNQERDQAPDTMIRTRFIDDTVAELAAVSDSGAGSDPGSVVERPLEQLVLLGAGLDSRAYRLACLSRTVVFELDVAPVLEYKAAVFSALGARPLSGGLHRVAVDFAVAGGKPGVSKTSQREAKRARYDSDASATTAAAAHAGDAASADPRPPSCDEQQPPWLTSLQAAGFDPTRRTLWVAEGLLMYLGVRQVANLLGWAAKAARVSTATVTASALAPNAASPSPPSASTPPVLHYFVADVVNEEMARSRLKWFRFFRWGCSRLPPPSASPTSASQALAQRRKDGSDETESAGAAQSSPPTPIEQFMRANGWRICTRTESDGGAGSSYGATSAASAASSDASGAAVSASASSSPTPSLPPPPTHLHIHPIGRDALSYGRYLQPPTVDSTSHPRKPPMLLETYMIRAQLLGAQE